MNVPWFDLVSAYPAFPLQDKIFIFLMLYSFHPNVCKKKSKIND